MPPRHDPDNGQFLPDDAPNDVEVPLVVLPDAPADAPDGPPVLGAPLDAPVDAGLGAPGAGPDVPLLVDPFYDAREVGPVFELSFLWGPCSLRNRPLRVRVSRRPNELGLGVVQ